MTVARGTTVRFARPNRGHKQIRSYAVLDPDAAVVVETWYSRMDLPGLNAGQICFGNEPFVVDPSVIEAAEIDTRYPASNLPGNR